MAGVRMGVDPGTQRVGLALSEPDHGLAYAHKTLQVRGPAQVAREIAREAHDAQVVEIVVGLPLHLDGSEGQGARRARALAQAVADTSGLPVVLWDERLSTVAAERTLRDARLDARRRRRVVDQVAATLLLQSYLDSKRERAWTRDDQEPTEMPPPPKPPRRRPRRGRGAGGGSKR